VEKRKIISYPPGIRTTYSDRAFRIQVIVLTELHRLNMSVRSVAGSSCSLGCHATRTAWDNAVGVATGYGMDGQGVGVRVPRGKNFLFLHVVQTGPGNHPASYPMGTGGRAAGV
jgi:hypothetical protein